MKVVLAFCFCEDLFDEVFLIFFFFGFDFILDLLQSLLQFNKCCTVKHNGRVILGFRRRQFVGSMAGERHLVGEEDGDGVEQSDDEKEDMDEVEELDGDVGPQHMDGNVL